MPLKTTSAPDAKDTCFKIADTCEGFRLVDGISTLNCAGSSHKEAT